MWRFDRQAGINMCFVKNQALGTNICIENSRFDKQAFLIPVFAGKIGAFPADRLLRTRYLSNCYHAELCKPRIWAKRGLFLTSIFLDMGVLSK